jgi:hypothetical protein
MTDPTMRWFIQRAQADPRPTGGCDVYGRQARQLATMSGASLATVIWAGARTEPVVSSSMTWLSGYLDEALRRWSDKDRYGWAAFAARNMRLDERIAEERQGEYLEHVGEPYDRAAWIERHREYELANVAASGSIARRILQKKDRSNWASPFRFMKDPIALAPDVKLIHVTSAYSLLSSTPGLEFQDLVDAIDGRDDELLEIVLDGWWRQPPRTIFAALAEDLSEVVTAARNGSPTWAENARDWLGLVHYEPLGRPVNVALLQYRVADVPRAEGLREQRPILAPVAIDSGLNEAFCPHCNQDVEGRCVDLAARCETPVREVIHPRPLLKAQHIFAVGQITARAEGLPDARWAHLEWIREHFARPDFAALTDGDLAA